MSYYQRHIFFCLNQRDDGENACAQHGAKEGFDHCKTRIKAEALPGPGGVRVIKPGCLDRCAGAPVAVVYPEAVWYAYVNQADIDEIVDNHLKNGQVVGLLYYVSNSNPNSTYTWVISGGNIVSGQGTDSIIVDWTINGTGTLTVVEITEDRCPSQPSVLTIVVSPQIYVPIGPAQTICEGQTTTLGDFPQAGFTYAWTPSTGLSSTTISNPSLTLNNVGVYTYYLFVIDANGCSNIDSVQVTVLLAPAMVTSSNPSTIICPYDSIILSATGAFTYQWYQKGNAALIGSGSSITVYPTTTTSFSSLRRYRHGYRNE